MHRIAKLLGIIFILSIVFFIICDEKGIKIELDGNHLVFNKVEKVPLEVVETSTDEIGTPTEVLYKNSDIIRIFPGFNNPEGLRKSDGMDPEFLAKIEKEKLELEAQRKNQIYTGPVFVDVKDSVSSIFSSPQEDANQGLTGDDIIDIGEREIMPGNGHELEQDDTSNLNENNTVSQRGDIQGNPIKVKVSKYNGKSHHINLNRGKNIPGINSDDTPDYEEDNNQIETVSVEKYTSHAHNLLILEGKEIEIPKVSVQKYKLNNKHILNLKNGGELPREILIPNDGILLIDEDNELDESKGILSDEMLEDLLTNEKIDVNSIETENDEFLQKVFMETKDTDVMNLIVENYLNEYQFIKAKKFLDNLPDMYKKDLKPSLNLRLVFNSFSLSSKTTNETLTNLVQEYGSNNQILEEDKSWYLGVLALMQQDYDRFFEIANGFTLEKHISFRDKIQGYKNQIAKQMGMPDYYFDTLVSLELFNQGLFQPAKVLALSSLQQNPNYILPYQVLAYANFLTSSWETSIEYMKKLVDLDPNNAEKYRFLMGIAYYWNEKYEQSVVMLSLIKDEKLRLDSERYLIRDYLLLDQKNKLILSWNKLLGYDNLVNSDFYTYFYEVFYHPYSEGEQYQLYAFDTELADKMIRVCNIRLSEEEKSVCSYGTIGKNIALGKFDGLEQSLLDLVSKYPQGYLYHALGEYYLQQDNLEKAKVYLLKAVSLTQKRAEVSQIKKLLQSAM